MYHSSINSIRSVMDRMGYLYPIGDLILFDLENDGNIDGTGSFTSHIKAGLDYWTPLTSDPSWLDLIFISSPPSITTSPK